MSPFHARPLNLARLSPERLAVLLDGDRRDRQRLATALLAHLDYTVFQALREYPFALVRKDDLVSELLVYLYRNDARILRRWDPEKAGLKGYLSMISTRYARRALGSQPVVASLDDVEHELEPPLPLRANPESELTHKAALAQLAEHLQRHGSELDRRRFQALYVQQRTPTEVARTEGASTAALHTWASRLKKRLIQAFPSIAELFEGGPAGRDRRGRS